MNINQQYLPLKNEIFTQIKQIVHSKIKIKELNQEQRKLLYAIFSGDVEKNLTQEKVSQVQYLNLKLKVLNNENPHFTRNTNTIKKIKRFDANWKNEHMSSKRLIHFLNSQLANSGFDCFKREIDALKEKNLSLEAIKTVIQENSVFISKLAIYNPAAWFSFSAYLKKKCSLIKNWVDQLDRGLESILAKRSTFPLPQELLDRFVEALLRPVSQEMVNPVEQMKVLYSGRKFLPEDSLFEGKISLWGFLKWVNSHKICFLDLNLSSSDLDKVIPKIEHVNWPLKQQDHITMDLKTLLSHSSDLLSLSLPKMKDFECVEKLLFPEKLTALEISNEERVNFTGTEFGLLKKLVNLKTLRLIGFNLSDELFQAIGEITNLECLEFHHGHISHQLVHLMELKKLKRLHLFDCGLTDGSLLPLLVFKSQLKNLSIGRNGNLTSQALWMINEFDLLEALDIRDCSGLHSFEELNKLNKLKFLNISKCPIHEAEFKGLKYFASLEELIFFGNETITDIGLKNLQLCQNLHTIILESKRITDEGLIHLRPLIHLEELFLWGSAINGSGFRHLASLEKLKEVSLHNSPNFTTQALQYLKPFKKLKRVYVSGPQVDEQKLRDFNQELQDR